MTPLEYLSPARFRGAQAGEFLQAQLSADIAALEPGDATWACYCSPRGQVIGMLLVCRQYDDYLVAAAAELLPQILDRLRMFVFRSKVEFSVLPDSGVHGIGAGEEFSGHDAFQPGGSALKYLFRENGQKDTGNAATFKAQEIRSRITWLGQKTSEKFIPQVLGFDQIGAVSFSKGCYPGQEIIARTRYLGKIKRAPVVVLIREEVGISPMEPVRLRCAGAWSSGAVIDSVSGSEPGTLCFIIAPAEGTAAADELEIRGRPYRCETI